MERWVNGRARGVLWNLCLSLCLTRKARKRQEIDQQRDLIMISCVGQGREWEGHPNPESLFGGTSAQLAVN